MRELDNNSKVNDFKEKIKEVNKDSPFFPNHDPSKILISNEKNGIHIFVGNNNESSFSAELTSKTGNTIKINNGKVISDEELLDDVIERDDFFQDKIKNAIDKIKDVVKKVDDFGSDFKNCYKKTQNALTKVFIGIAVASSLGTATNVVSTFHDNDYSWSQSTTKLREHYKPIYDDFDKHKDIYSICEQDKSLCVMSASAVATLAVKNLAVSGTATALLMSTELDDDSTTLKRFLKGVEESTGYALTKETSEKRELERESKKKTVNNNLTMSP